MTLASQERFPGVDLAKIIAIYFVMVIHVCGGSGLDVQSSNLTLSFFRTFLSSISLSCIDLFALATGFLCINSSCRYSRIVSLWAATFFWGITALLFSQFCLGYSIPFKIYFNAIFPVWRGQYWFFTAYFMLFFFMPCLNRSVKNMTKREFQHLLIAIGIFICGYSIYSPEDLFSMRDGYSFPWLCIVYLIGAYLRIYPPRKIKPSVCFSLAALISVVSCLRQLASIIVGFRIPGDSVHILGYVSPFTLGIAITIFLGCINLKIGEKTSRHLKTIAATTFGIYLIHVQPFVWTNIWCATLHNIKVSTTPQFLMLVFPISTLTFIGLALLEHCRIKLFSKLGINSLIQKIDKYLKR